MMAIWTWHDIFSNCDYKQGRTSCYIYIQDIFVSIVYIYCFLLLIEWRLVWGYGCHSDVKFSEWQSCTAIKFTLILKMLGFLCNYKIPFSSKFYVHSNRWMCCELLQSPDSCTSIYVYIYRQSKGSEHMKWMVLVY